jgi:hypothetical protein
LPWSDTGPCGQIADALAKENSVLALSGALLFTSCRKQPILALRQRIASLGSHELSPKETWVLTCATLHLPQEAARKDWTDSLWKTLPQAQCRGLGCSSGSWSLSGERWDESLITTLYTTLTMERSYRYNNVLFNFGAGK